MSATLLTEEALAERWQTTPRHIRRLRNEHGLPFIKLGKFVRFDPAAVDEWARTRSAVKASKGGER